ncbi:YqzL family protein [Alkaliphilus oremlandii]|uniref:YqzL family protein n=1 Tax=Alkaliphilus oremlandii TaxID=461876 RepID=UPI00030659B5|nr:YqzL family protein [Alkaliphilus oremlandii]
MFNELNNVMWNIFEKTGNIYAYLYVQEYNKNKSEIRAEIQPLEMKETTII